MDRNRRPNRSMESQNQSRSDRSGRSMKAHQPAGREYENQYIGSEPRRGEYGSGRDFSRNDAYRTEMSRPQFDNYSRQSMGRNDDRQFDSYSQEDSLSSPYREQTYDNQRSFMNSSQNSTPSRRHPNQDRSFGRTQSFDSSYGYDEIEDGSYENSQHQADFGASYSEGSRHNQASQARPYSQMNSGWGRQQDNSHNENYRLNGYQGTQTPSQGDYQTSERDYSFGRGRQQDSYEQGQRSRGAQPTYGSSGGNYGSDLEGPQSRSTSGRDWGMTNSASTTSFKGKGPKGFKRSDERIKEQVCDILEQDHSIDASEIDVEVKDGEVTLTGTVQSREDKRLAEQLIEDCAGVKDVINNIRTSPKDSSTYGQNSKTEAYSGLNTSSSTHGKTEKDDDQAKSRNFDKNKSTGSDKNTSTRLS